MKKKGKRIYMAYAEYEAIYSALDEIETNCEAADEDYIEGSQETIRYLHRLIEKFMGVPQKKRGGEL